MLRNVSNILNLSGGKDSTAMLLLAIRQNTPISEIVFADTGNEHQHVYDYLAYLSGKIGVAIKTVIAPSKTMASISRSRWWHDE